MSLEVWKQILEISAVILLFFTFLSGAGLLYTSTRINKRQTEQLRQFDKRLADAKTEQGKQEERAAKAELALKQYVDEVAKHAGPRSLDAKIFLSQLKGKPKASVRLFYNPNDSEAYMFAQQIHILLGPGEDGQSAGWEVSGPKPIPPEGWVPQKHGFQLVGPNDAPPAARYQGIGVESGLTLVTRDPVEDTGFDRNTAGRALTNALLKGLAGDHGDGSLITQPDPTLPGGSMVLVVGQKRQTLDLERFGVPESGSCKDGDGCQCGGSLKRLVGKLTPTRDHFSP